MSLSILSFLAIVSILPRLICRSKSSMEEWIVFGTSTHFTDGVGRHIDASCKLLGMMGDPSMLYSLLIESMLPSVFALMQYTILSQISASKSAPHQPWQIRLATGAIVAIVLLFAVLQEFLPNIIASILY